MDRGRKALPVQNKACHQRYVQRCQERHRQKLRDMKCSIDNKPPREGSHLKTKAKKNFLMEERMGQIETENRILLQKMTNIMRTKGSIDNKNESVMYGRSLTKEHRKRELQKIMKQNHKILERIQNARPTYNHHVWAEEAKNNNKILANISEFKTTQINSSSRRIKMCHDDDFLLDYDAMKICSASEISRNLKASKKGSMMKYSKSHKSFGHKKGSKSDKKSQKSSWKSQGTNSSTKLSSDKVAAVPSSAHSCQPFFWNGPSKSERCRSESPSSNALKGTISSAPTIASSALVEKTSAPSPRPPTSEPSGLPSESSYKVPIQDMRVRIYIQGSSMLTRRLYEYSNTNLYYIMVRYVSSILNATFSSMFIELLLFMEEIVSEEESIEVEVSGMALFRGEPRLTSSTLTELIRSSLEDESFHDEILNSSYDDALKAATNIEATIGAKSDEMDLKISGGDSIVPQLYTLLFSCTGIAALVLFRIHHVSRRGVKDDTSTCSPPERIYSTLSLNNSLDSITCSSMKNNSNAASIMGTPAADVSYESAFDNVCFHKVLGVHNDCIPEGRCDISFYEAWENAVATPRLSNFSKKREK